MVKMIPLVCPNCGAKLDVKDGTQTCFCTYCGTKILVHDPNTKTINIHSTITDEAAIKRAEHEIDLKKEDDSAKQKRLEFIGLVITSLVIYGLLALMLLRG